jgi:drug/metabolite transporter (DMT)-like permease
MPRSTGCHSERSRGRRKHYPPTLVATHTYVNPIVAVLLGWLFAGERISPSIVASTALAIGAIGLVQRGEEE